MDMSESTNEVVNGVNETVSELMRDAVLLLGETLSIAGEAFSISGFCTNGRHQVYFTKFKNFEESYDESKARLSNVKGEYSTRLGVAIRHAGHELELQSSMKNCCW